MSPTQKTVLAAAAWATGAAAAAAAAGVIPMSIAHASRGAMALAERSDTYTETLTNNISYGGYFASISVGTPGQLQDVILDTGSSDLWVLGTDVSACAATTTTTTTTTGGFPGRRRRSTTSTSACLSTFDTSSSTSFTNLSLVFDIEYVDNSQVAGYYFTDTVQVAGATLAAVQLGLAATSDITYGIMGIGFAANEAAATPYPNVIDQLYTQGLIGARAYSLYLDDLDAATGSILLGGVDADKYSGSLIAVPVLEDAAAGNYTAFSVTLSSVAAVVVAANGTVAGTTNYSIAATAVVLDSGTTLTYLPEALATSIMATFGATYDSSLGYATVDCTVADDDNISLQYQFGGADGPVITVAAAELVISSSGSSSGSSGAGNAAAQKTCVFGVSMSSGGTYLLGDTFLRSAYAVYDLDAKVVALAQTNFDSSASSVSAIESGRGIPGVAATASGTLAAATGTTVGGADKASGAARVSGVALGSLVSVVFVGATFGASLV